MHSLALKSNGRVVAWGTNDYGQSSVPTAVSNVIAIDGGELHSLALVLNPPRITAIAQCDSNVTVTGIGLSPPPN